MSKQTRGAILFIHHSKHLVRVQCETHNFNYVFISEIFNKLFNFQEKKVCRKPTLMELYEKTYIN
jgi:hypothetical protein